MIAWLLNPRKFSCKSDHLRSLVVWRVIFILVSYRSLIATLTAVREFDVFSVQIGRGATLMARSLVVMLRFVALSVWGITTFYSWRSGSIKHIYSTFA